MTEAVTGDIVVTAGAVLSTRGGDLPLAAYFTYVASDPLAVSMTLVAEFEVEGGRIFTDQTTWIFARRLIHDATTTLIPTGDGDVTFEYRTTGDDFRIDLTDLEGAKHPMFVDAQPVVDFLAQTYALVPADGEIVDVDAAITLLLAGEDR